MRPWEKAIRSVVPYVPGEQPSGDRIIKLNTNENPYPPAPGVQKALREMDGEQVYLLKTEDREGREALYEINQEALNERLKVEGVYGEFKSGKYYKFRVAGKERYDSHYPVVCGAVSLIEGFSETPES